jgi:hypothetical protein
MVFVTSTGGFKRVRGFAGLDFKKVLASNPPTPLQLLQKLINQSQPTRSPTRLETRIKESVFVASLLVVDQGAE